MSEYLDDLSCNDLVELVTAYLDDALTDDDRTRVEVHLVACEGCDAYVDQMCRTVDAVAELRTDPPAPEATEALLDAFRGWRDRREEES